MSRSKRRREKLHYPKTILLARVGQLNLLFAAAPESTALTASAVLPLQERSGERKATAVVSGIVQYETKTKRRRVREIHLGREIFHHILVQVSAEDAVVIQAPYHDKVKLLVQSAQFRARHRE